MAKLDSLSSPTNVLNCHIQRQVELAQLLSPYGIKIESVADEELIPGSFFGEREAGLKKQTLYLRTDTPVHSALHEAGHYICMDQLRRESLDTDVQGGFDEENGVCYLQILMSDQLQGVGKNRMMQDMDSCGYTFRLGNARTWFEQDAEDARRWLCYHKIIDSEQNITLQLRDN